ncbi:MAG TPA: hypothetical protein VE998_08900 [Terriglobales bacterium]|nr:hypothetical protein [Terriglobales bacterium]
MTAGGAADEQSVVFGASGAEIAIARQGHGAAQKPVAHLLAAFLTVWEYTPVQHYGFVSVAMVLMNDQVNTRAGHTLTRPVFLLGHSLMFPAGGQPDGPPRLRVQGNSKGHAVKLFA